MVDTALVYRHAGYRSQIDLLLRCERPASSIRSSLAVHDALFCQGFEGTSFILKVEPPLPPSPQLLPAMLSLRSSHLVAFIGMLLILCLMAQPSVSAPTPTSLESRGIPFGVQYNKRVAYADFSTGITACGQRHDKSLNSKNTLGVDTKFGKGTW
ncbi:hypothetical protein BDZ90DRAFT_233817 [Jaminaea rosea]|uniref:Uncharacterized protein n=1 Tax=Jaminaea rosea TaxID=1569628 RepID=A0A316UKP0_9BASI|nr:hypothetical protein BDZ90DRAFT_233817 [Jaminaea rosea]PWN25800.1 hypothetical protein BDZ90DRAFT_233817 [Jaminaea rosea]